MASPSLRHTLAPAVVGAASQPRERLQGSGEAGPALAAAASTLLLSPASQAGLKSAELSLQRASHEEKRRQLSPGGCDPARECEAARA